MAPHFSNSYKNALISRPPALLMLCLASVQTQASLFTQNNTNCSLFGSPARCSQLHAPNLLTQGLESKVSTYGRREKSHGIPLCARCVGCSTASWESPVTGVGGGESSQSMGSLEMGLFPPNKKDSVIPFHSFTANGELVCSRLASIPQLLSKAQGRALLAGWIQLTEGLTRWRKSERKKTPTRCFLLLLTSGALVKIKAVFSIRDTNLPWALIVREHNYFISISTLTKIPKYAK